MCSMCTHMYVNTSSLMTPNACTICTYMLSMYCTYVRTYWYIGMYCTYCTYVRTYYTYVRNIRTYVCTIHTYVCTVHTVQHKTVTKHSIWWFGYNRRWYKLATLSRTWQGFHSPCDLSNMAVKHYMVYQAATTYVDTVFVITLTEFKIRHSSTKCTHFPN